MKTIEATYRIVTPMFIGGADQKPSDGIRPPSFKGALRFWWRALNWGRFRSVEADDASALRKLHEEEVRLFGGSAEQGGQGCFLLTIEQSKNTAEEKSWPSAKPLEGSGYLGLGLWESGKAEKNNYQPHRIGLEEGVSFSARLTFRSGCDDESMSQIVLAMKALGFFGGLGSRSRRGFGSVSLETLRTSKGEENFCCKNTDAYRTHITALLHQIEKWEGLPPYTAWSAHGVAGIMNPAESARKAHEQAAKLFYKVRGRKAEVRGVAKRAFGQPLPLKPMKQKYDSRRASPLFFHIHPVGEHGFLCANIFLPARFLAAEGHTIDFYSGVQTYMSKLERVL